MRWAVLVGGTGSNLKALLESGFGVDLVVSHRSGVGALAVAEAAHIPTVVLKGGDFSSRQDYDRALCEVLADAAIERVAMAGFLRWLTPHVVTQYRGRLMNIHPSLLPAFPGLHAIEQAFQAGVMWTGVTIHLVDEGHDTGPILAQCPVPRLLDDTIESLTERIHQAEHRLYPKILSLMDDGDLEYQEGHIDWKGGHTSWAHGHS